MLIEIKVYFCAVVRDVFFTILDRQRDEEERPFVAQNSFEVGDWRLDDVANEGIRQAGHKLAKPIVVGAVTNHQRLKLCHTTRDN